MHDTCSSPSEPLLFLGEVTPKTASKLSTPYLCSNQTFSTMQLSFIREKTGLTSSTENQMLQGRLVPEVAS